ncbi:MAG: GNAT family N-acetyltransferase [Planctomycetota bacterium]|jgi:putative acetyltransferase
MKTVIRAEGRDDYAAIEEVNRLAFGQDDEARLVNALRQTPAFDPALSLLAVQAEQIIGHILFSPIHIETDPGMVPALALAPMAVVPKLQRRGIGTRLVLQGVQVCRRHGHDIVVVVGHPDFYARFGFVPAASFGLRAPFDVPEEAFRILALGRPESLQRISGVVRYPPAFNEV